MPWPTSSDYQTAIQNPRICFSDLELRRGAVLPFPPGHGLAGMPRPFTGTFGDAYQIRVNGRKWAVKCFTRQNADRQRRYAAISEHMRNASLPYTVGFVFLEEGIRVDGQWYPVLKMEWVDGEALNEYIQKNLGNQQGLQVLARRWLDLVVALKRSSIVHGDLQHGNILVVGNDFKLIDYDGMYVPALGGEPSHEVGHRNYQHPFRTGADFGPYLDNFSAWVIYVSLLTLSLDPALWSRLGAGEEHLLFRRDDFDHPESSQALLVMERSHDERIQRLGSLFRSLIYMSPPEIPSLDGAGIPEAAAYQAGARGLPPWLRDYVKSEQSTEAAGQAAGKEGAVLGAEWVLDLIQPPDVRQVSLDFACTLDRVALLSLVGLLALLGYNVLSGIISGPVAALWGSTTVMIVSGLLAYRYRMVPVVQAKRHLCDEESWLQRQMKKSQKAVQTLKAQTRNVDNVEKAALLKIEDRRQKQAKGESREIRDAEEKMQRKLANLNSRRSSLKQEEAEAIRRVEAWLHAKIGDIPRRRNTIDQAESYELSQAQRMLELRHASIRGIGPKLTSRLLKVGITKASDVTPSRVSAVPGFGDVKTAAVLEWRRQVEANVQGEKSRILTKYGSQRQALEAQETAASRQARSEEGTIRAKYRPVLNTLDNEEQKARGHARGMIEGIRKRYQAEQSALEREREEVKKKAELQRKEIGSIIAAEHKSLLEKHWTLAKLQRQVCGYRRVTFATYLTQVFLG